MQKAVHLTIRGKVQGVFFRAELKEQADHLGITGWVRNCTDGSVEGFAQGETHALKKFEAWCAHGPSRAEVTHIEKDEQEIITLTTFQIR